MKKQEIKKYLPKCLSYEIADNTSIIDVHAWAVCIEDSSNPYLYGK